MTAHADILAVLEDYFRGIHEGDVERLRSAFHPTAVLWGVVRGAPYHRAVDDYLTVVKGRQSPQVLGEQFAMQPLSIDVQGPIALAKVSSPMLGFNYVDLLSLLYQDGKWKIVAKVFTHVEVRELG